MVLIVFEEILDVNVPSYGFRPLAGIMVLIGGVIMGIVIMALVVSVPLRGLWFLSFNRRLGGWAFVPHCFRPLAGIMVLIKAITTWNEENKLNGFRPLAGIMVLILVGQQ